MPTEVVERLFIKVTQNIKQFTSSSKGLPNGIGRLSVVDSTEMRLPEQLCDWAFISKGKMPLKCILGCPLLYQMSRFQIKLFLQLELSDYESSDILNEEEDTIYVMDRGFHQ
ncbi:hypothetical protein GCM10009865_38460 [Aeromicrobium ponti]|uniref:hypothetical protein n=1 Tax=Cytobacillus oceanisediminis TaxID=665099 RepID=UPI0011A7321A|nr:hypothetical protein [Cytobacillus oceanisediminis]